MLKIEGKKGIQFEPFGRVTYIASIDLCKPGKTLVRIGKVETGRLVYQEVRELEPDRSIKVLAQSFAGEKAITFRGRLDPIKDKSVYDAVIADHGWLTIGELFHKEIYE